MIMAKIIEKEKVTVEREIIKGIECDVCKRKIVGKYWKLSTHHYDWGNDSIESYEDFDLCSPECISVMLNKYYERCKRSDTQAFELEQASMREVDNG